MLLTTSAGFDLAMHLHAKSSSFICSLGPISSVVTNICVFLQKFFHGFETFFENGIKFGPFISCPIILWRTEKFPKVSECFVCFCDWEEFLMHRDYCVVYPHYCR